MTAVLDTDLFTTSLPDGDSLIYFVQALDNAANVSVADYKAYYHGPGGGPVDRAAPVTQLNTQPAQPNGHNGWYVSPVTVTLTASDDLSGVAYTQYRLQEGAWLTYTAPFVLATEGETVIAYRSADLAGNIEAVQTHTVSIDSLPPTTALHLPPPTLSGWYTAVVTVTLTAVDLTSGLDTIFYQLNGGSWQPYAGPVLLADNGEYVLAFYSVDVAGRGQPKPGLSCGATDSVSTGYNPYLSDVVACA